MADDVKLIGFDGPISFEARAEELREHVGKRRFASATCSRSAVYRIALDIGLSKLEREAVRADEDEAAA